MTTKKTAKAAQAKVAVRFSKKIGKVITRLQKAEAQLAQGNLTRGANHVEKADMAIAELACDLTATVLEADEGYSPDNYSPESW